MQNFISDLKAFVYYLGFWLLICFLDRLIFIISFFDKIVWTNFLDIFLIYYHGFVLDLSVISYISVIPFLFYNLLKIFPKSNFEKQLFNGYTLIILILFFITTFINVNIYREWGDKISKRAIDSIFEDTKGVFSSAGSSPIFIPVLGLILTTVTCYWLFLKLFKHLKFPSSHSFWRSIIIFCIGAILLFTLIRGGYGRAPLNPSRAYFSQNSFYNHAAVNTQWALLREYFTRNQRMRSPYHYFQDSLKTKEILEPIFFSNPDSSLKILKTDRPNVVLIILESYVGDLIEAMGGKSGITPHIDELIKKGVFFDHIYAASDRSDKGIIGIFSGFPAQGPESIIKYIDKHENMSSISQELGAEGFHSSFYYGGQSEFYNMKSFMLTHGINRIVDHSDFNLISPRTSWGVYDHIVFKRMLKDLRSEKEPFFSSIFTLVNHEPFELKGDYKFGKDNNVNKFKSTAYYTDESVFNFIEKAKQENWYKNTLFILVADHGHRLPAEKWDISNAKRFHIPLLFFGEVVKEEYRGLRIEKIGNQTDLATTLLKQLNLPTKRYPWSRDLLNPTTSSSAFYNSKDAFGIVTSDQILSYDRIGNSINYLEVSNYPKIKNDSLLNLSKAYYQEVYEDFMKY